MASLDSPRLPISSEEIVKAAAEAYHEGAPQVQIYLTGRMATTSIMCSRWCASFFPDTSWQVSAGHAPLASHTICFCGSPAGSAGRSSMSVNVEEHDTGGIHVDYPPGRDIIYGC